MSENPPTTELGVEKALGYIKSMLIPEETLEAWAIQRRWFSLTHRRTIIAATSGRFVAINRGLFGGFEPIDVRWQDLQEAKVKVGVLSASITIAVNNTSDLTVVAPGGRTLSFTGLRKAQAQDIYRICQTHEQAWREKRRVRELEELRAKSGGVQISSGNAPSQPMSDVSSSTDSVKRLQQAKQMLDAKLISDSEYESIKARIINSV